MTIDDETTINLNGEEYWTVQQFARLTEKEPGTIRVLISKGNRVRKLKTVSVAGKPFILASELFEFPFVITGRPAGMGDYIERYFINDDGDLVLREELLKHDD